MNSTQLLAQVGELSGSLGELDSDISDLKYQLRSFAGELPDDETPSVLPADFEPAKWRADIDNKLIERHKVAQKLQTVSQQFETVRKAELDKAFSDIERRYRKTIVDMVKSAVAFGRSLRDAESVREEARQLKGTYGSRLVHVGPTFEKFDLADPSSFISHWLSEAKRAGFLDGSESWLSGVSIPNG